MNTIRAFGNLTRDIEIATSDNGTQYARFSIASDRGKHENAGTDFFPVVAFGEWTQDLTDLRKGVFVELKGSLITTTHEGHTTFQIRARKISRVAPKNDEAAQ